MELARDVLRDATTTGFVLIAVAALRSWRRYGTPVRGYLAGALGLLALVSVGGIVGQLTDYRYPILFPALLIGFLASGYLLLMFRHSFIPLSRPVRIGVLAVLGATAIATAAAGLPYEAEPTYTQAQSAIVLILILVWSVCVGEPVIRFWRASKGRPAVQRARLRALSVAYGGIIAILFVGFAAQPSGAQGVTPLSVAIQAVTVLLVPLLYVSFEPPRWLRRAWREPEEEALRAARELVMFAPDAGTLADRALDWACRLVGGEGGILADEHGEVLAQQGMKLEEALEVARDLSGSREESHHLEGNRIVVPITSAHGAATLVVMSGRFVVLFGSDEVERLRDYATTIGVGLDRITLTADILRLEESKAEFIANAAHELRTPLATIVGFSSLFAQTEDLPEEDLKSGLQAIARQGDRLHALIDNLLDLTQVDLGRLKVDMSAVAVSEPLRRVLDDVTIPDGRTLDRDIDPDLRVWADPYRLEQVLANLISNAVKYGGSHIVIDAERDDGTVEVRVSDDGTGVPEGLLPDLFEPFHRGTNTRGAEGSGLGLAIVRRLVEAQGGTVSYEPAGQGARFVVSLKAAP